MLSTLFETETISKPVSIFFCQEQEELESNCRRGYFLVTVQIQPMLQRNHFENIIINWYYLIAEVADSSCNLSFVRTVDLTKVKFGFHRYLKTVSTNGRYNGFGRRVEPFYIVHLKRHFQFGIGVLNVQRCKTARPCCASHGIKPSIVSNSALSQRTFETLFRSKKSTRCWVKILYYEGENNSICTPHIW